MITTKTGYGRITKGRNIPTERSIDEIIKSESVAVRRSDKREVRQNWNSDFQDYQAAMDSCGANDRNFNSSDY